MYGHPHFMNLLKNIFDSASHCIPAVIAGITAVLAPIALPVMVCFGMIGWDAYLGCRVSKKVGRKLESRRIWATVSKALQAAMLILAGSLIDTHIVTSIDLHLVEAFAGLVAGSELISIAENQCTLNPDHPWWKILSKFVKTKGEKYLNITIEKEDLEKVKKMVRKVK